jgi:muconolactone delta-isomerase
LRIAAGRRQTRHDPHRSPTEEAYGMEFLVTMTTHVPAGTTDDAVAEIRAREAAHSADLAAAGQLLRLWRPPLEPGEWRTLGLFAADSPGQLQDVLISMPLHIWRTDEVTPLSAHPNDPAATGVRPEDGSVTAGTEFFTTFTEQIPPGTPATAVAEGRAGEARRTRELTRQGHLLRLWKLPPENQALGLWRAADSAEVQSMLSSLPLDKWLSVQTTQLSPHPSDPAATAAAAG